MTNRFRMMWGGALALTVAVVPGYAAKPRYLALGDSIAFGYRPPAPPPPQKIKYYVGYPEILDQLIPKQAINASCPGQSSRSFLFQDSASLTEVPGQNCETMIFPDGTVLPGWKDAGLPLHPNHTYTGSQADFAVSQLLAYESIELVTISLGGNDLLRVQYECAQQTVLSFAACVQGALPAVLLAYGNNLATILTRIRQEANYSGTIVLVKYFATSTDPLVNLAVSALNNTMAEVGAMFGATIADGYTAFQTASLPYGGDPCEAGLLARLDATTCDVHPSLLGQQVLATSVVAAIYGR